MRLEIIISEKLDLLSRLFSEAEPTEKTQNLILLGTQIRRLIF